MTFIIGKKIEMTQHFCEDGRVIPVTLVQIEPNIVTRVQKNEEQGDVIVQLGTHQKKALNKPEQGYLKELPPLSTLKEFHTKTTDLERGQTVDIKSFEVGAKIDVIGISKGRGFAGVMKRHGFSGQPATHGQKDQMR
ncbi:50S ribosomal protein L3, partial [Candidatus Uhrbacteria bacterium RIFOXYA2_FULL_40_9]